VRIDLKKASEGKSVIPITSDNIFIPPGIMVNRVDPSIVEITLDTVTSKEVPVQVDWKGHLDDSLILSEVKVSPSSLVLVGGKSVLNKLHTVYTTPVELDNIRSSGNISVPVLIMPPTVKLGPGMPDRVVIEYVVRDRKTMEVVSP
jgi:YbbR domain-containing protein